jgi:hypothetical protein
MDGCPTANEDPNLRHRIDTNGKDPKENPNFR